MGNLLSILYFILEFSTNHGAGQINMFIIIIIICRVCLYSLCIAVGLGTILGDQDLRDNMDAPSVARVVESTLWRQFERFL